MLRLFPFANLSSEAMTKIDTTCPMCSAPHSRKLSLIFLEGLSTTHSSTHSVGKTNTIAPVTVTSTGTTVGVQQSSASAAASPPFLPPVQPDNSVAQFFTLMLGLLVGILLVFAIGGFAGFLMFFLVIGCTIAFNLKMSGPPTAEEIEEHKRLHAETYAAVEAWQNTFACGACGHRFIPGGLTTA